MPALTASQLGLLPALPTAWCAPSLLGEKRQRPRWQAWAVYALSPQVIEGIEQQIRIRKAIHAGKSVEESQEDFAVDMSELLCTLACQEVNGLDSNLRRFWTGAVEYCSLGAVPRCKFNFPFLHFIKLYNISFFVAPKRAAWELGYALRHEAAPPAMDAMLKSSTSPKILPYHFFSDTSGAQLCQSLAPRLERILSRLALWAREYEKPEGLTQAHIASCGSGFPTKPLP